MNTIHPEAIILVEAEIWPNFIWKARDMGIPLFLVNARFIGAILPALQSGSVSFPPALAAVQGVGCAERDVTPSEAAELGCRPEAIRVVGSLKFDAAKLDETRG